MAITDDFNQWLTQQSSEEGIFGLIIAYIYPILILAGIVAVIFIAIRILKNYSMYAGVGERLGKYKIMMMGMFPMTGNLSVNDSFFQSDLVDRLKEVSEITTGMEEIERLTNEKQLYAYDFKVTDHDEALDLKGNWKKSIIISPVPIQSDNYSWVNMKGEFSIVASGFKEYPRIVLSWIKNKHYEIRNVDGSLIDIWVLVPIPKDIAIEIKEPLSENGTKMVLKEIKSGKEFATAVDFMPVLSETYRQIAISQKESDNLRDLLHKKDQELASKNIVINKARHLLNQKIFVGYGKPQTPLERGLDIGWLIASVVLGGFGYALPEMFPTLTGRISPWVGVILMMGLVIGIRILAEKKKSPEQQLEKEGQASI